MRACLVMLDAGLWRVCPIHHIPDGVRAVNLENPSEAVVDECLQ